MLTFYELLKKKRKTVIGLMSGTSVDGIDAAIVEITGYGVETTVHPLAFETFPFSSDVRHRILALCQHDTGRVDEICEMNFHLGHLFAEAVKHVLKKNSMSVDAVDLIGSHGQTIHHLPRDGTYKGVPSTLQIGEPAVIAHETGLPTIADFRVADMAAGGQGAPLVSYPDYLMFRNTTKTVGLLNIGGIANLTVLPADANFESVTAADTGPGNMCVDAVVNEITGGTERYDEAGERAAQGTAYRPLVEAWMRHPFFRAAPPKTTGREMFGHTFAMECLTTCRQHRLSDTDAIATLTEFTVQTIARSATQFAPTDRPIEVLYVSGGGVHNRTLMRRLGEVLTETEVAPVDSTGISADAKEAIAFALLANESLHGERGNLPAATGASTRKILGKFVCP